MRHQSEFAVTFYEGSQFINGSAALVEMMLPAPPAVGTFIRIERTGKSYRVHSLAWVEVNGQFTVHVFLDKFPG